MYMYGSLIFSNIHVMELKLQKISFDREFDRKFDRKYTIADSIMSILDNGLTYDNNNS